jgi:hypothetical protein
MRRFLIGLVLLLVGQVGKSSPADMPVGMNVGSPVYFSTCWHFRDLVKSAQYWPTTKGGLWDPKGLGVTTDPAGWPNGLDPSQIVYVELGQSIGGDPIGGTISPASDLPAGTYTLCVTGRGSLQVQASYRGGGVYQRNFDLGGPAVTIPIVLEKPVFPFIALRILGSNPADHVRDIRFLMPGYAPTAKEVWNDELIAGLKGFAVIRCMDLAVTNDTTVKTWADRSTPTAPYTYGAETGKGIPPEYLAELAERTGADLWVNIPHTADDDYAARLGELLKATLPPACKVYVEFSNECWNGGMKQAVALQAEGAASGRYPSATLSDRFNGQLRQYAWRAKKAHDAFASTFGTERMVRVLGAQAANYYTAETALDEYCRVLGGRPPTLAVAAYIGLDYGQPDNVAATKALGVDGILKGLVDDPARGIPQLVPQLKDCKKVADRYGCPLAIYEGGLHLIGLGGSLYDQELADLFAKVNRDPRIKDVVSALLRATAPYAGPFCWFSYVGPFSRYGSWGAKEYERQADSPKYLALRDWLAAIPGPITPASPATLDLIAASRASHAALEAARKAAAELEAKVLAADRAVAGDLQSNGAYVDTSTTPPTVYSADPSQPAGFRAEPVRVGPSKDTRGPQDALPPARRPARRAA